MCDSDAFLITTGADFADMTFNFTVEGTDIELGVFRIKLEDITIDDDVHEIEQSFALIAEIGDDVPERLACFQRQVGDTECFNRTGATKLELWTTMVRDFHIFMSTLIQSPSLPLK